MSNRLLWSSPSRQYASTDYRERRILWFETARLVMQGLSSLIAGDFNCIVGSHEKIGGRQHAGTIDSREFREFISDLRLIDLGYIGPRFT